MIPSDRPLFVHSDIGRGLVAAKRSGAKIDARDIQKSLVDFLASHIDGGNENLLFPAFNYDFGASRIFDVDTDPAQIGILVEWLRKAGFMHRSPIPFFSMLSGRDLGLDTTGQINPFGKASGFQWLIDQDATLMLFGAPLNSLTFIHYVEEMSGGPLYRYTKNFPGQILQNGNMRPCDFAMHVRPMGVHLDYDWPRIAQDLSSADILRQADYSPQMQWLNARALLEFWGNRLADDPFYLIDVKSRTFFEAATDGGKNRVKQKDFEDV